MSLEQGTLKASRKRGVDAPSGGIVKIPRRPVKMIAPRAPDVTAIIKRRGERRLSGKRQLFLSAEMDRPIHRFYPNSDAPDLQSAISSLLETLVPRDRDAEQTLDYAAAIISKVQQPLLVLTRIYG